MMRSATQLAQALLRPTATEDERHEAARSLAIRAAHGCQQSRDLLESVLMSAPNPDAQYWAAQQLGFVGDVSVVPSLVAVLSGGDRPLLVRAKAAEAIGHLAEGLRNRPHEHVQEALCQSLHDPAPEIRFWALFALGCLRSRRCIERIEGMRANDDASVPGWWRVSEEAADVLTVLTTGQWPER